MKRLDWLIKDKRKLKDFISLAVSQEYCCDQCPFCGDDGMLMGCNTGYAYDDIDCQLNYEDVIDFLEEEMPTKKQKKSKQRRKKKNE